MTDYTNPRWHVHGAEVTHDDFPRFTWQFGSREGAERQAARGSAPDSHFACAWLAAQPKPVPEEGMRIEATLRGGAVVSGLVTNTASKGESLQVHIGGLVIWALSAKSMGEQGTDILTWHEVAS